MIADGSGVANMRSVRRWSAILALAGVVAAPSTAPAQTSGVWKVDDRASLTLMREFYDQLARLDAVRALQAAQRAAMKELPHPFAWAAFGLAGVGR
jgi:CHAT domain-containing protein